MTDKTDAEERAQYTEYADAVAVGDTETVEMTRIEVPDAVGMSSEVYVVRGFADGPHVTVRPTEPGRDAMWLDVSAWTPEADPWTDTDGLSEQDAVVAVRAADYMVDILIEGVSEKAVSIDLAPHVEANPRLLGYAPTDEDEPTHTIRL